jgi:transposase
MVTRPKNSTFMAPGRAERLRRIAGINPVVVQIMVDVREKLAAFYSDIGRPSIDPELLIRMLIVGYCYGVRSERQFCQENSPFQANFFFEERVD